jgi:hypothetical protein
MAFALLGAGQSAVGKHSQRPVDRALLEGRRQALVGDRVADLAHRLRLVGEHRQHLPVGGSQLVAFSVAGVGHAGAGDDAPTDRMPVDDLHRRRFAVALRGGHRRRRAVGAAVHLDRGVHCAEQRVRSAGATARVLTGVVQREHVRTGGVTHPVHARHDSTHVSSRVLVQPDRAAGQGVEDDERYVEFARDLGECVGLGPLRYLPTGRDCQVSPASFAYGP